MIFPLVRQFAILIAIVFFLCAPALNTAMAESAAQWHARLSPNPISFGTRTTLTGSGEITASLDGHTLKLQGVFSGLQGKVTAVKLHLGPKAIPGPALSDIDFSAQGDGRQGRVQADVVLNDAQLQALQDERLYLQLYSEVANEGNLRGWLLEVE